MSSAAVRLPLCQPSIRRCISPASKMRATTLRRAFVTRRNGVMGLTRCLPHGAVDPLQTTVDLQGHARALSSFSLPSIPHWAGMSREFAKQLFPLSKGVWSTKHIPDLTGQVIIVTGGNTGIGYETTSALLRNNAKVYIAARNETKTRKAIQALKAATSQEALFLPLDLGDLHSVKEAAAKFQAMESRLDVLVNNAGVFVPSKKLLTANGYDLQFGTNTLGHYYFTTLLMPQLIAGAARSPEQSSRVVTLTSAGHVLFPRIEFDTLRDGPARDTLSKFDLYNQSKFGNCVFAVELARRYAEQGIVSIACHPGLIRTKVARHTNWAQKALVKIFSYSPRKGALTSLYAATAPEAINLNGKYLIPWAREWSFRPEVHDRATGEQLWSWLEAQVTKSVS